MNKRILIVGGTGLLGKPVAVRLFQEGYIVGLMIRDVANTKRQFGND